MFAFLTLNCGVILFVLVESNLCISSVSFSFMSGNHNFVFVCSRPFLRKNGFNLNIVNRFLNKARENRVFSGSVRLAVKYTILTRLILREEGQFCGGFLLL